MLARSILKWTAIAIGILIVLIIIAIIVIPHVVNTEAVKSRIEAVATQQTGRRVSIEGPLSLSLFPWIGFDAHDISVANAKGFEKEPFMHVKEAQIHARLIPLIFGRIEVSGITLDAPGVHLARKENGRSNWQDLIGADAGASQPNARQSGGSLLARLSIGHIAINDATLTYDDAQSGKHFEIRQFSLAASKIAAGQRFPLSFSTHVASNEPHFRAAISFDTQASFGAGGNRIALTQGTLTTTITRYGGSHPIDIAAQWNRIALNSAAGTAAIAGLRVSLSDLKAELDATATGLNGEPEISGHLIIPPFSPRKVLATLGHPVPRSFTGFNQASLNADLSATADGAALTNVVLKLDDSTLRGSASIPDVDSGGLRFDLALNHINLSDYIVPGGKPARLGMRHGKRFMATRLPGRLLEGLDVAGTLTIGRLSGFGLEAHDIALGVHAGGGAVRLEPVSAKLYSGSYRGRISVARAGRGIRIETSQKLENLELAGLIRALTGNDRLSGTSSLKLRLAGRGKTVGELLSLLEGEVSFSIADGALHGIDLWDALQRAYVLFKAHKRLPAGNGPKVTKITNLRAHAIIKRGRFINDTLVAKLPFLAVSGHGSIDFFKANGVDYHLLATVVSTPKISGRNLEELKSVTVPIEIAGSLSDLSVYPDIEAAFERHLQSKIEKKKKQLQAEAESLLEENKKQLKSKAEKKLEKNQRKLKEQLLDELFGDGRGDKSGAGGNGG